MCYVYIFTLLLFKATVKPKRPACLSKELYMSDSEHHSKSQVWSCYVLFISFNVL